MGDHNLSQGALEDTAAALEEVASKTGQPYFRGGIATGEEARPVAHLAPAGRVIVADFNEGACDIELHDGPQAHHGHQRHANEPVGTEIERHQPGSADKRTDQPGEIAKTNPPFPGNLQLGVVLFPFEST